MGQAWKTEIESDLSTVPEVSESSWVLVWVRWMASGSQFGLAEEMAAQTVNLA